MKRVPLKIGTLFVACFSPPLFMMASSRCAEEEGQGISHQNSGHVLWRSMSGLLIGRFGAIPNTQE